ncbi:MAG TPA: sensor histidine kinase [Gaiellaceae bacterium]|nr:sensor histidine kinase [Gaiellaceae bacterium]
MRWPRASLLVVAASVLALLGGLAFATVHAQRQSRSQLEQRFVLRTTLGARFTAAYVRSVVALERTRARRFLSGHTVSEQQFRTVVDSLQFPAALLLDARGRVLYVWPRKPSLVGTPVARRYAHLAAAVAGRVGISNVVPSAARGIPVVAFAVPFRSAAGRRVFSGAFAVSTTPIAAYLETAMPFSGGDVFLVDGRGRLIMDNRPHARRTGPLGASDPALAAKTAVESTGTYGRDGEARFFARAAVPGTPWQLVISVPEAQLFAPIGGGAWLLPWILLAGFALVAALAALLFMRLSDHRQLLAAANDRLAASNAELRELDRLKDEFVALVSHELRTPLTSILGYVSALQRERAGPLSADQRTLLAVVDRNAQRLLHLVGDLLFVAKASAGKLTLELQRLDLVELAQEAVASARPNAETREVDVELVAVEPSLEVEADRARLAQVLDNLISNALKFTAAGGHVRVSVRGDGPCARIDVEDDGIGIPLAEQRAIFGRFFRARTATERQIPGTGLGLSIAKTVVELHDGTIDLASEEGRGTTVSVRLPFAAAHAAAA